jgi:farnesyl diphosphate synthase
MATGKCNRGLSVVDSYKLLKGTDVLPEDEMFLACTLGWCIEWVIIFVLGCCCDQCCLENQKVLL